MSGLSDDEEIPLPLLRPLPSRAPELVDESPDGDRLRPAASGAIAGLLAGAAALGVFHYLMRPVVTGGIARAAAAHGVAFDVSVGIAYATAAAAGALLGAVFASVTRYLRRWVALAIWAVIFFESVAVVVLASFPARLAPFAPAAFAAAGLYGLVASLALPIRRR